MDIGEELMHTHVTWPNPLVCEDLAVEGLMTMEELYLWLYEGKGEVKAGEEGLGKEGNGGEGVEHPGIQREEMVGKGEEEEPEEEPGKNRGQEEELEKQEDQEIERTTLRMDELEEREALEHQVATNEQFWPTEEEWPRYLIEVIDVDQLQKGKKAGTTISIDPQKEELGRLGKREQSGKAKATLEPILEEEETREGYIKPMIPGYLQRELAGSFPDARKWSLHPEEAASLAQHIQTYDTERGKLLVCLTVSATVSAYRVQQVEQGDWIIPTVPGYMVKQFAGRYVDVRNLRLKAEEDERLAGCIQEYDRARNAFYACLSQLAATIGRRTNRPVGAGRPSGAGPSRRNAEEVTTTREVPEGGRIRSALRSATRRREQGQGTAPKGEEGAEEGDGGPAEE